MKEALSDDHDEPANLRAYLDCPSKRPRHERAVNFQGCLDVVELVHQKAESTAPAHREALVAAESVPCRQDSLPAGDIGFEVGRTPTDNLGAGSDVVQEASGPTNDGRRALPIVLGYLQVKTNLEGRDTSFDRWKSRDLRVYLAPCLKCRRVTPHDLGPSPPHPGCRDSPAPSILTN
jgi:hypothetical protein